MSGVQPDQTCASCIFYESEGAHKDCCRRMPPTGALVPAKGRLHGQQGLRPISYYPPVVLRDKGCGEYEQNYPIEDSNGA